MLVQPKVKISRCGESRGTKGYAFWGAWSVHVIEGNVNHAMLVPTAAAVRIDRVGETALHETPLGSARG